MLNYWCYEVFSNMIFMQNSKIKANFTCKETCSFVEHFNLNLCQLKFYDQLKIYAQLHIYGMMHCAQTPAQQGLVWVAAFFDTMMDQGGNVSTLLAR